MIDPQFLSAMPTWLQMLAQIYPPQHVVLIGAGNGTDPLVAWLQSLSNQDHHKSLKVTLLEPDQPAFKQLAKRTGEQARWIVLSDMVVPNKLINADNAYPFHEYSLTSENGYLDLDAVKPLWPGIALKALQQVTGVSLNQLLPADWLLLDCLPAAELIDGIEITLSTQVILIRAIMNQEVAPVGSSFDEINHLLEPNGFKAIVAFDERNSNFRKIIFVREPLKLQRNIEVELKTKEKQLEKINQLQDEKEKSLKQFDDLNRQLEDANEKIKDLELQKLENKKQINILVQSQAELQSYLDVERQSKQLESSKTSEAQKRIIDQTNVQTQSIQAELDSLKKLKDDWVEINKNPYAHNRILTGDLNSGLKDFAYKSLGLNYIKPAYLYYLASKARQVEKNCIGRLATTVQDAVTRQLVLECLLVEEKAHILEIGALYGVGMAILYNHAITRAQDVRLICLDPFDGYYGKAVDALLNQPVNDLTFKRNMKLANVPESDYAIVKRYSTDPLALEEVKRHAFNLLIIDGDHSYEGVKFDFENFFPLLEKGGYIIFDDYNAKEWPGVQKFIDEDLNSHSNIQFIGAFSRTAVARKLY